MAQSQAQQLGARFASARVDHDGNPVRGIQMPPPDDTPEQEPWEDLYCDIVKRGWATDEFKQGMDALGLATDDEVMEYLHTFMARQYALRRAR